MMTATNPPDSSDFTTIFLQNTPLLDLRAPIEFLKGAFPTAVNLPLMSDDERQQVGICYKNEGQQAAILLGNKLVAGEIKAARMKAWKQFVAQNPQGYLYCFRGGLRSKTVQQWLRAEGINYPLIKGGYKMMRQFLITTLETLSDSLNFIIIGGRTGTRKTDLILANQNAVDLEGRANHRGSSFGRRVGGQPSIINFENQIAIDLLQLQTTYSTIFLEDEGVTIGRCSVPEPLRKAMGNSPLYLVEASVEERVENILRDYVLTLSDEYISKDIEQGWDNYRNSMFSALERIKKRLGGECYARLHQLMDRAFKAELKDKNLNLHRDWIRLLLVEYYDPMYDFQLKKKQHRIRETGNWTDIANKLAQLNCL